MGARLSAVFLVTEALLGAGLVLLKKVAQNADAWWNSTHLLNTLGLIACLALLSPGQAAVQWSCATRGLPRIPPGQVGQSGFSVSGKEGEEALDLILHAAEEVPYNVQVLAHGCWDQLRAGNTARERVLSLGVVEQVVERIVRQYDPFYTQLWNSLTAIQQKTLMAVISEQGMNLQSRKVVRILGKKGPSTVRRSLEALMGRDILREEERQGSVRMRFEDPFLGQWIRKFTANL